MSTYELLKRICPRVMKRHVKRLAFFGKYGFPPPPSWSDLSGYEAVMDTIIEREIYRLDGDLVEIGAFLGGGTYKLSRLIQRFAPEKRVIAIDIFQPDCDSSVCTDGTTMRSLYRQRLRNKDQYTLYREVTGVCENVVTIVKDSIEAVLPCDKVSFAYIDGNHTPQYVRSDFLLVWNKMVSDGVVCFDDYGFDLPEVTSTIHDLMCENRSRIKRVWTTGTKTIFIQKK